MTDAVDWRWPSSAAIVDVLAEYMAREGPGLRVRDSQGLAAGFDRARLACNYDPALDAAGIAALIFEGTTTRHPLVDGNKRLAWLSAVVFLDMNGAALDAREVDAFEAGMALIRGETRVEEFAAFLRANILSRDPLTPSARGAPGSAR